LQRSRTNKVIGGVSGGLGEYTGIDPLLWRVGFVAVTLAWGVGLVIYPLLWLLMPAAPLDPNAPPAVRAPRAPAGPRSPVPGMTLAALLIVAGIGALVTRFTDLDLGARGFLGSALVVLGIGLVIAALTGVGRGARGGLVVLGIVLSIAAVISTSVDFDDRRRGPIGDRDFSPDTVAEVEESYEGGVGDLEIDLTRIDPATIDRPVRFAVHHGIGDVDIVVPRDADVYVSGEGGIGEIEFEGQTIDRQGSLYPGVGTGDWVDDGRAEFRITLTNGIGDVEVSRG
jgi:phage shock protein PspC (stress-responsive transcriptional regulator)/predicted membrane protein